ncbi:hypothetical protein [Dyadobacter alkalitolerans]|uniref:hypothetical protein n=1 Tax=Dyadobacter alkalitolerans TaxID=492736 RepID=UPI00041C09A0|nr:hypothetical protein [Dyadobacter alkalitolerans]
MEIFVDKLIISLHTLSLLTLMSGVVFVIACYALWLHPTWWHRFKAGQMAEATILKADQYISADGKTIIAKLILLVRPAAMRCFVAEIKYRCRFDQQLMYTTGVSVLVKFNPKNKGQVIIIEKANH